MENCLPKPKLQQKLCLALAKAEVLRKVPRNWHAEAEALAHP